MPTLEVRDKRLTALVGEDPEFEKLGTGFLFTEGPLWHPVGQFLLFSDMPGDIMRRWDKAGGVTTHRTPCFKSNGLAYDTDGHLLICQHATSTVTHVDHDGKTVTIASHWQGKELNSPNDVVARWDNTVYFTDPTYGRMEYYGVPRPRQLDFQGVYLFDAKVKGLQLLADDFGQPNGLCFSLDQRRLFVNDTERKHIRLFDVRENGTFTGGAVWAETKGEGPGAPDGMKIDSIGNIYCCGPGGIHVFAPDATCLGVIKVPEHTTNFCFGDGDYRSLFITASTSLYRMRTRVPGRPIF
jgi:gluconolactonase